MLKKTTRKIRKTAGARFAVVASRYNAEFVDGMLRVAESLLKRGGAAKIEVLRVPGSFEVPVVAATLARRKAGRPDVILCFGVIWQGETTHAQHIGEAVSFALMDISVETGVPVIHQVLTVATKEQAVARCLTSETNRGAEAAHTALAMVETLRLARKKG